jgi:hypothetical protein
MDPRLTTSWCSTDKEINEAKYGQAPEGERFLITGHENFRWMT